jgi:hypothetical protein
VNDHSEVAGPALPNRLLGRYLASKNRIVKQLKSYLPRSKYRPEFQRHWFPGISLEEKCAKVAMFQGLLGQKEELAVEQLSDYIFRIRKRWDV